MFKYIIPDLLRLLITFTWLTCFALTGFAQEPANTTINSIISTANNYNIKLAREKLYLQTDKPMYSIGDTIWFKGYLLEESFHASTKSGILYVEMANDSNRVIKRIMLPVFNGLAVGNIALSETDVPPGSYILRAYTNWMRNYDEAYVFKKHLYINQLTNKTWLINYNAYALKDNDKDKFQLNIRIETIDKSPVSTQEMQLKVTNGKRTLAKSKLETDKEGLLSVKFDLLENTGPKHLSLIVDEGGKDKDSRKLLMPLILNQPGDVDIQFMPEGGHMVAGLPSNIAFKAITGEGYGTDVSGKIYNSKEQEELVAFHSTHKGTGTFNLTPKAGETYSAKIKLPDGSYKSFPLPAVQPSGITLQVINPFKTGSLNVTLKATPDITSQGNRYYLMGRARGIIWYGASFRFVRGEARFSIKKDIFPSGIVHFTLIRADKKAINERIIFIDHSDNLNIRISNNRLEYQQRDSVTLNVEVSDKNGTPVQGSFSLAVTDNGQVKQDSVVNSNILTHMLLSANLKGTLEDPGYYANCSNDADKWRNMDQLLLAQGWSAYDWSKAFAPEIQFSYAPEPEFLIKGRVTNAFNKPVPNSRLTLLSKRPLLIADTVTNANGSFTFKGIFPADTAVFFIQAKNKKGKSFNVGIEVDEFKPPVFSSGDQRIIPWYVNIDTNNLIMVKKQVQLKESMKKITGGILLEEVVIKSKKIVKGSKNLNGPGEADIIINEEELEKVGRTTLGDLLEKRVKGFGYKADKSGQLFYRINGMVAHLIIDGMDTEFFLPEGTSLYDHLKFYLDYYDAEEIKGIEVMTRSNHSGRYFQRYINNPMETPWDHAFIEVTTRSGHGPFMKKAVGTYIYRPMPFSIPQKFYAPKYTAKRTPDMSDVRSTIHWEPNIVTDKEGKASVTFYTADRAGTYTYILEGADLKGNLGIKRGTIIVGRPGDR